MNTFRKKLRIGPFRSIVLVVLFAAATASAQTWTSIGPEGGTISRLVPDLRTRDTVYAISSWGGTIFKTTDGAQSWNPANSGLTGIQIMALALDRNNSGAAYALTFSFYPQTGPQLFRSTDGGSNWTGLMSAPDIGCCSASLAVDNQNSMLYLGSCFNRVFRSTDGGETWTSGSTLASDFQLGFSQKCVSFLAVDSQGAGTIYAAISGGAVFKSTDAGESWNNILDPHDGAYWKLAIDPGKSDSIYALAQKWSYSNDCVMPVLFKSTDGGSNWTMSNLPDGSCAFQPFAFDPRDPSTIYTASSNGLFQTTDGGTHWKLLNAKVTSAVISSIAVASDSSGVLYSSATREGGVTKSVDGGDNWSPVNFGLHAVSIRTVAVDPRSSGPIYAGSETAIWKSSDSSTGLHRILQDFGSPFYPLAMAIDPSQPDTLYLASGATVLKTTDAGANWRVVNNGAGNADISTFGVLQIVTDPRNPNTLYAAAGERTGGDCWYDIWCIGQVLKSTDGGDGWITLQAHGYFINDVVVDPQNPDTLYAGAFGVNPRPAPPPHPGSTAAVLKSEDAGASWNLVYSSEYWTGWAFSVAIDPQNSSTLYAYTPGILKSSDGGKSWSGADSGLTTPVRALVIDPQTPATLYAGTDAGVFRSSDGGASWNAMNAGLTSLTVSSLTLDPQDPNRLYAGTLGGGVFRITLDSPGQ